ncbi:fluoride efflux transporter FluC [Salinicoccus carnicancri]|uniref:fluoride efflux transporter FluC n=1 Tax=Salinicoccus carnicancri TaxID=558170 RepID=UPI00037D2663|nr:CrcB family protein [Salinicoccus carnicancri]
MKRYSYIASGAMIGAVLRLTISLVSAYAGLPFFTGTFIVNMLGAFAAGYIMYRIIETGDRGKDFFITGLLGSFTTFSMLSYEQYMLLSIGDYVMFTVYIAINLMSGLILAALGFQIAGRRS